MTSLSRMIYVSRKQMDTTNHAAMEALMQQAAANNTRDQITGLLTWSQDAFLQILEGPREALWALLCRIQYDQRHDGVMLIEFRAIGGRVTQSWAMAAPNPRSRAQLADLSYDHIVRARPDDLIRRLSQVEASTSLSFMSQLQADADFILV